MIYSVLKLNLGGGEHSAAQMWRSGNSLFWSVYVCGYRLEDTLIDVMIYTVCGEHSAVQMWQAFCHTGV